MVERNLGNFLKEKRKELKLSLRQASLLIGISHSYLDKIEKSIIPENASALKPSANTIRAIADAYNVNYDYLLELCGYLQRDDSSLLRIVNPDILRIAKAEANLTNQQAGMIRKYAEYMFPEAFENIAD